MTAPALGDFTELFSVVDRRLGELLGVEPLAAFLIALCSGRLREGHVCLDLAEVAGATFHLVNDDLVFEAPELERLESSLRACGAVEMTSPTATEGNHGSAGRAPLVLRNSRLYLRRYDEHEQRLARDLANRLVTPVSSDVALPAELLAQLFPGADGADQQRKAAELACRNSVLLVSGGPGTGKTATVAKILVLLAELGRRAGSTPRVLLLAPTGKAAARVKESLAEASRRLGALGGDLAEMASEASTIHRALGVLPDNRTRFRRSERSPLPHDVVIVDEASMVDLSLMRSLVEALRPEARLLLLGDRHQLASVEAGSVLSELWMGLRDNARWGGGAGSLVELDRSYRFSSQSGIGALAAAIRDGDCAAAWNLLAAGAGGIELLERSDAPARSAEQDWLAVAQRGYAPVFSASSASHALIELGRFRVLCAHRKGAFGVAEVNERIRTRLARDGLVPSLGDFYQGRPIIITRNDYERGLYNGDVGVLWPDAQGRLEAHFETARGPRALPLGYLPQHETAFALTVHKSQGSEYDSALVVLPEETSALLSRELLYTAITRAKSRVVIVAGRRSIEAACVRSVERSSGLAEALRAALDAAAG